jgi:hypothetical protein
VDHLGVVAFIQDAASLRIECAAAQYPIANRQFLAPDLANQHHMGFASKVGCSTVTSVFRFQNPSRIMPLMIGNPDGVPGIKSLEISDEFLKYRAIARRPQWHISRGSSEKPFTSSGI